MAYFNGFPATYPQYYQQPQQQQNGSPIWIQGEAAAKSYLVAPNSTVVLFDSEQQTIYLKSADASGMPSIKVLDYVVRDSAKNTPNSVSTTPAVDLSEYATKSEMQAVFDEIKAINNRVDSLAKQKGAKASE